MFEPWKLYLRNGKYKPDCFPAIVAFRWWLPKQI